MKSLTYDFFCSPNLFLCFSKNMSYNYKSVKCKRCDWEGKYWDMKLKALNGQTMLPCRCPNCNHQIINITLYKVKEIFQKIGKWSKLSFSMPSGLVRK